MPGSRYVLGRRKHFRAFLLATKSSSSRGFTVPVARSSKSTHGLTRAIRSRAFLRPDLPIDRTHWVSIQLPCGLSRETVCASDQLKPSTERRSSTSSRC